jgi:hypothetical protein
MKLTNSAKLTPRDGSWPTIALRNGRTTAVACSGFMVFVSGVSTAFYYIADGEQLAVGKLYFGER